MDIEIEIDEETGETSFKAKGIKGKGCTKALGEFMDALGDSDAKLKPTSEMYETEKVPVRG